MKAYTDIEQSKKLAEILPVENADMRYSPLGDNLHPWIWTDTFIEKDAVPCWSLAALLEEIPEIINFDDDESDYALEILKESCLYYLSYGNILENYKIEIEPQEDFVDACYEMILRLHELKIL